MDDKKLALKGISGGIMTIGGYIVMTIGCGWLTNVIINSCIKPKE